MTANVSQSTRTPLLRVLTDKHGGVSLALLIAAGALSSAPAPVFGATTFVVNRIGDAPDLNLANAACDTSTNTGNQCTLRAAIQEANDTPGADTINFNISGPGLKVIAPASALPAITDTLTINGYGQGGTSVNTSTTGNNAVLRIVLDGVNAGEESEAGLELQADDSLIRGLVIQRFDGTGIAVLGASNTIRGNFIGTNAAGTVDRGNGASGISVTEPGNIIGGPTPAARNVISGNAHHGVAINGDDTGGLVIEGNHIGTNAAGTAAIPNDNSGIAAINTSGARIGGTAAGSRNVISGNAHHGIAVIGTDNFDIQGNRIGTRADGTGDLGNALNGIAMIDAREMLIGGSSGSAANLVANNGHTGVEFIGDSTGMEIRGNAITANGDAGVVADGTAALIAGNAIFGNVGDGVRVADGIGVQVVGNQILGNSNLGIDLVGGGEGASGVTPNDNDDLDTGANNLQNFPVLNSASRSIQTGVTTVTGLLNSTPNRVFRIALYLAAADGSGHGEGQVLIATQNVTTNGGGDIGFAFQSNQLVVGHVLTATATRATNGSTSEFSANRQVAPGQ